MEIDQTKRGRPSGKSQHLTRVLAFYRAGASLSMIGAEIGVSPQTISRWLKEDGVTVEPFRGLSGPRHPLSDEHKEKLRQSKIGSTLPKRAAWKNEVRQCPVCQREFVPSAKKQILCSISCRNTKGAGAVRQEQHCQCGNILPPKTISHSLYCSPDCRRTYGKKRTRDESKWSSRECRNCGLTFEFRLSEANPNLYCSLPCSMKHTKVKHHVLLKDDDVVLDSTYETFVWAAFRIARITVERFDRQFGVEWRPGGWYAPDLWLPQEKVAIECKGHTDDDDEARWAAYRATEASLIVLDRDQIGPIAQSIVNLAL